MSVPRIRLETVEAIARKILMEYDSSLLSGEPRPIPIEAIIEVKFDLILEYHILRKNGAVLGETIFDDGPVILYDMDERSYKIIAVRKGTILIDERLCETRSTVIAAPITSRRKTNLPTHVSINRQVDKLRCNSVILMEQIRTIDKSRLMDRIGVLNDYEMQQVNQALGISVGLV